MVEIFDFEQRSDAWYACRLGIPTSSDFAKVLMKGKQGGESIERRKLMMKLLGERLTGDPQYRYQNDHMERGQEHEAEAKNLYALITDVEPTKIGFMRNGNIGCSPDGGIGTNGLLEVKSKLAHIHLEVLIADAMPAEHIPQVQGQLLVSELEFVDFMSYCPKLQPFIKRIHRDEPYIKKLKDALDEFNDTLSALEARFKT